MITLTLAIERRAPGTAFVAVLEAWLRGDTVPPGQPFAEWRDAAGADLHMARSAATRAIAADLGRAVDDVVVELTMAGACGVVTALLAEPLAPDAFDAAVVVTMALLREMVATADGIVA